MIDQKNETNKEQAPAGEETQEEILDNSALVEEMNKQESQIKQRADAKEAEKQIVKNTPPSPVAPASAPPAAPASTVQAPPPPPVQAPAQPNQPPATPPVSH